jgi:hypothetical protein
MTEREEPRRTFATLRESFRSIFANSGDHSRADKRRVIEDHLDMLVSDLQTLLKIRG